VLNIIIVMLLRALCEGNSSSSDTTTISVGNILVVMVIGMVMTKWRVA